MENTTVPLYLEENRLKTFTHWIFPNKEVCNVKKMAEAGFIFTGNKHERDSAKCFLCSKNLDGWEKDDDPWKEHKSHSPQCAFAKIGKAEEDLTLVQFLEIITLYYKNKITANKNKQIEECKRMVEEYDEYMQKEIENDDEE